MRKLEPSFENSLLLASRLSVHPDELAFTDRSARSCARASGAACGGASAQVVSAGRERRASARGCPRWSRQRSSGAAADLQQGPVLARAVLLRHLTVLDPLPPAAHERAVQHAREPLARLRAPGRHYPTNLTAVTRLERPGGKFVGDKGNRKGVRCCFF
jgi:hypothetical protein